MLTQYRLTLQANHPGRSSWAYPLYAFLLRRVPNGIAQSWHQNGWTPLSQHLTAEGTTCRWTINLLNSESEAALSDLLAQTDIFSLHRNTVLSVQARQKTVFSGIEAFWAESSDGSDRHRLTFCTPTAFKSQGSYRNFPTIRFLLQSLIRSWNLCGFPCIPETSLDALSEGLPLRHFTLTDRSFPLKGHRIPGFVGAWDLENGLSGEARQLLNALLYFSQFSGLGIKTTLGMGGVEHAFLSPA